MPEFAFGMFDGGIGFALGYVHAFSEEFEVVDQIFHAEFHFGALGRGDFVVVGNHRAGIDAQPVGALFDDAGGLAHFVDTAQVAVVAVAVDADGNVEVHLVIDFVGLGFAYVPIRRRSRAASRR